ncbi:SusD/RagB family nutrient-binding outer membrane lipoprotein [Halalkalibaculum sp. DA384]|uniref:SusD/RagB family nutrient-binding outer membrane lipoprotein n=1 Tax=Halalkalibaculum sp. DA384 TaxID=3373606 RepID=UPI0037542B05
MKHILLIVLSLNLLLTACTDLSVVGENPNNVSQAPPQLLLTQIASDAFQVAGKNPQYASRMIVSTAVENEIQYYKWGRGNFDDYDRLRNITKMIEEANRTQKPAYEALGRFFRAYYFYNLTLRFGDIPYSDALKAESEAVYAPEYDPQEQVFSGILDELQTADQLLNADDIIEGDIIYGGDASKWKKLINSFRLKVLITLSNKTDGSTIDIVSRFADIYANRPLMESIGDNGQLEFFDQIGSRYGEFNDSDYGSSMYMDSTFIKRLQDREDPRLFIYAAQTKNAREQGLAIDDFSAYEGGRPTGQYSYNDDKAAAGNISKVDPRYYSNPTNEPHVLLGYPELQFILAEASVRSWIGTSAKAHYENGIRASFEFYNTYAENYASFLTSQAADTYLQNGLVSLDNAATSEQKIERIVTQKYLQSFLQGGWTPYFEHLRTGYPYFMEPSGGAPPTRWIYPQSEYQNNNANVSAAIERQFSSDNIRAVPWWLK